MIQWFILSTRCGQGPVKSLSKLLRLTRKGCCVIIESSESEQRWFDSNATDSVVHFCNIFTLRQEEKDFESTSELGHDICYRCVDVTAQGSFMLPWCSKTDRWVLNATDGHWPHAPTSLTSGWTLSNPSTRGSRSPADLRLSFSVQLFCRTCLSLSPTRCLSPTHTILRKLCMFLYTVFFRSGF